MIYIDESATVRDSAFGDGTRVYRNAFVLSSDFGQECLVSDSCRVENSHFGFFTWLYPNGTVYSSTIQDYSYAQKNSTVWHSTIGKYCSLSWNVSIGGGEHDFSRVTTHSILYASMYGFTDHPYYDRFSEPCVIGNDVWIGAGAQILRGVRIGDGAVIAAGAIVTKDVEPYAVMAGVPAVKKAQRCSDEMIEKLLQIRWWDCPGQFIRENMDLISRQLTEETVEALEAKVSQNRMN